MGMFDTIDWKRTNPGDPPTGVSFQSKDIYANMSFFEVREDGSLWRFKEYSDFDWDEVEALGIGKRPEGRTESPPPEWEPCDHSGRVCLYDQNDSTYSAVFDSGALLWIGRANEQEYYKPRVVQDYIVELIELVMNRNEQICQEDVNGLSEVVRILRVL